MLHICIWFFPSLPMLQDTSRPVFSMDLFSVPVIWTLLCYWFFMLIFFLYTLLFLSAVKCMWKAWLAEYIVCTYKFAKTSGFFFVLFCCFFFSCKRNIIILICHLLTFFSAWWYQMGLEFWAGCALMDFLHTRSALLVYLHTIWQLHMFN